MAEKSELEKIEASINTIKTEYAQLQQKVKNWREDTGYTNIPDGIGIGINLDINDGYEYLDIIKATNKMHKLNRTLNQLYSKKNNLIRASGKDQSK